MVHDLRQRTGADLRDCKEALEKNGDVIRNTNQMMKVRMGSNSTIKLSINQYVEILMVALVGCGDDEKESRKKSLVTEGYILRIYFPYLYTRLHNNKYQ